MDPTKFDDLTKALATATSRRQALKTIAATTFGGILGLGGIGTAFADQCKPVGIKCFKPQQCCSKNCSHGKCCASGQTNCGGTCVNLQTNNNNCGSCGNICDASQCQTCQNGTCVSKCDACSTCQGGTCVSSCASGQVCLSNGTCATPCSGCTTTPCGFTPCGCFCDQGICGNVFNIGSPCSTNMDCSPGSFCHGSNCRSTC